MLSFIIRHSDITPRILIGILESCCRVGYSLGSYRRLSVSQLKERAPASPDSVTLQQLWDTLGSKIIEATKGEMVYTQKVGCSNPLWSFIFRFSYHHTSSFNFHLLSVIFLCCLLTCGIPQCNISLLVNTNIDSRN